MNVIVVNTGTELLLGTVLNTHLPFIAREIFPLGLRVDRQITVPDGPAIKAAVSASFAEAEIVFVTGGLGPTTDDITRDVVADLLGIGLRPDPVVLAAISARLAARGLRQTERIARQAEVPKGATPFLNLHGTAPGLYFPANLNPAKPSPHLFLLPGPPRELQPMFHTSVLPLLRQIVPAGGSLLCRTYRIAGVGESIIEEAIGSQILAIPGVELGYCARPGEVDLRIVGENVAIKKADVIITGKLGGLIFTAEDETFEEVIVKLLINRRETLATAESCTGGYLAHRLTNVPGASAVFLAGYVTYANAAKMRLLQVESALIDKYGAVSEPVVRAMADGARADASANHALATTGIAGPDGGSDEKPIGTVFIAVASDSGATIAKRFQFPSDRETFKQLTAQAAFEMLRQRLRN